MNRNTIFTVLLLGLALIFCGYFVRNTYVQTPKLSSTDNVISLVMNVPEVKQWMSLFTGPNGTSQVTGGKPVFTVISETNNVYVVKVYEDTPDHVSTFGFYDVSKTSGIVTKE